MQFIVRNVLCILFNKYGEVFFVKRALHTVWLIVCSVVYCTIQSEQTILFFEYSVKKSLRLLNI